MSSISDLNLFRDRLTSKIIMPDGIFTLCIVNCTNKDLYMMNVRGDGIEKLKPIENIVDGEKINLGWPDKLAYGWLISKHFLNGLPSRCDGTIKVYAIHQTYKKSSLAGERVVRDFQLIATYNPERAAWKDANYIPIVEMNTVVSFDYDFLEQMLLQFESSSEGVMAMIEGKLTQYDGLVTMLVNCSEHDYYTIVDKQIIPVPSMNSFDWFTYGEDSEFGLNEEYRNEAIEKWKSSIMNEFGLSKNQIQEGHDMFVSITASHDYPRRKMNLKNLPKDKTYQKFLYPVKRVLKDDNADEYLRPFFIEGSNTPVFRSKEAAELFIKVFKGKISLYHGAQHAIRIKRMADYKIDLARGMYVRKEKSVIKTAKRFVISTFMDKSFDIICNAVMKFMDFLLGKGSKAAKKASEAAMVGKTFYKMSSSMFAAGLGGLEGYSFAFDKEGKGERMKPMKATPINKKASEKDSFGHFVPRTPGSYVDKEEASKAFDKELEKIEEEEEYKFDTTTDVDNMYYDMNGIPIRGGLVTLMDYRDTRLETKSYSFKDKRKNGKLTYIPKHKEFLIPNDRPFEDDDLNYDRLEDYEQRSTNSKSTIIKVDFDKIMKINMGMYYFYDELGKLYSRTRVSKTAYQYLDKDSLEFKEKEDYIRAQFAILRNKRDEVIMQYIPEYIELRATMQSDIDSADGFGAAKRDKHIPSVLEFQVPKDHPYLSKKDFVQATPSYSEIVEERIIEDNGGDDRWQTDRLEIEESYEEDQLAQKRMGEKGKGIFRRIFDKVKSIWCSRPAKIIRRVVGLGIAVVGIWKAINKWKDLAEALIF